MTRKHTYRNRFELWATSFCLIVVLVSPIMLSFDLLNNVTDRSHIYENPLEEEQNKKTDSEEEKELEEFITFANRSRHQIPGSLNGTDIFNCGFINSVVSEVLLPPPEYTFI